MHCQLFTPLGNIWPLTAALFTNAVWTVTSECVADDLLLAKFCLSLLLFTSWGQRHRGHCCWLVLNWCSSCWPTSQHWLKRLYSFIFKSFRRGNMISSISYPTVSKWIMNMAILKKSLCQRMPFWTPTTPNAFYFTLQTWDSAIDLRFYSMFKTFWPTLCSIFHATMTYSLNNAYQSNFAKMGQFVGQQPPCKYSEGTVNSRH